MPPTGPAPRHRRADAPHPLGYRSRHAAEPTGDAQRRIRKPAVLTACLAVAVLAPSSWAALTSVPSPTQPSTQVVTDAYQRTVASGLGAADLGGAYSVRSSAGVSSSVGSGAATVGITRSGSFNADLPSVSTGDTMSSVVLAAPTNSGDAGGFYFALGMRRQSSGAMYRAMVSIASGKLSVHLSRYLPSSDVTLASKSTSVQVQPADRIVVQGEVTGTGPVQLAVRAWVDGTTPPAWQLTTADSSAQRITSSGSVGPWAYESSHGVAGTFAMSDLRAWSLNGPTASDPSDPSAPSSSPTPPAPVSSPAPSSSAPSSSAPSSSAPGSSSASAPPTSSSPGSAGSSSSSAPSSSSSSATPTTPVSGPSLASRGSAAPGSTSYVVPGGAIFVSPSGNDSANGTIQHPLRTVAHAVAIAKPGSTIVLRRGTYHEAIVIGNNKSGLTIQSYPKEAVWFDGARSVTNWTASGGTWVSSGWTAQFDHSASFTKGVNSSKFIGSQNPMAAYPDAVWVNGAQLTQVGSAGAVKAGTFYADYAAHRLVIGSNPKGHSVAASDLDQAFRIFSPNVTLQGFGVRRYATPLPSLGAVRIQRPGVTLRNLVVTQNATLGIATFGDSDTLIDHVSATNNGMVGIHANQSDSLTLRNSVVTGNNAQHFNTSPSAAGLKITRSRHLVFANNLFANNDANGLWLDQSDVDFVIVNNTFRANHIGTQLELADTGIVANNTYDGGVYGLYFISTGNVQVYNNAFTNSSSGLLLIYQDHRRQANTQDWNVDGDKRYPTGDSTDPWLVRNITVVNNLFQRSPNGGWFQFYVLDKATNIPADNMHIVLNGNEFFWKDARNQPSMVGWGGSDNHSVTVYNTPAELAKAKNSSWHNLQDGVPAAQGKSALAATGQSSAAVALPADIAKLIGVAAGVHHIGPFSTD